MATKVYTEEDLKLCAGACGRITRPGRMKAHEAPNTVPRYSATECQSCHTGHKVRGTSRAVPEERITDTMQQVQRWNQLREERARQRQLAEQARRRNWMGIRA